MQYAILICFATIGVCVFCASASVGALFIWRDNMQIKLELLQNAIFDTIREKLSYMEIDMDKIADTTAINALSDIKDIINDKAKEDFNIVEEIVCVFEKYNIDIGERHDF